MLGVYKPTERHFQKLGTLIVFVCYLALLMVSSCHSTSPTYVPTERAVDLVPPTYHYLILIFLGY